MSDHLHYSVHGNKYSNVGSNTTKPRQHKKRFETIYLDAWNSITFFSITNAVILVKSQKSIHDIGICLSDVNRVDETIYQILFDK